jgi:Cof subfamily protein (haloacid dehalogenase superfamily)
MHDAKTLYIADLDGTLLNSEAKLSDYTKQSLNRLVANGLQFSVATARLLAPVQKVLAGVRVNVPVILMNGVLIYDIANQKYVRTCRLHAKSAAKVIQAIRQFSVTGFMYELNGDELRAYHEIPSENPPNEYVLNRIKRYQKDFVLSEGLPKTPSENTIFFTLIDTKDKLQPVYDTLQNMPKINLTLYKNVYSDDLWYLEVFSHEASKLTALSYLRQEYGFSRIVAFGDNHNDLPMFEASDTKVAVANATPEIKNLADDICESNDDDGVVKWLEMHA